jgi:hypothetical protein
MPKYIKKTDKIESYENSSLMLRFEKDARKLRWDDSFKGSCCFDFNCCTYFILHRFYAYYENIKSDITYTELEKKIILEQIEYFINDNELKKEIIKYATKSFLIRKITPKSPLSIYKTRKFYIDEEEYYFC